MFFSIMGIIPFVALSTAIAVVFFRVMRMAAAIAFCSVLVAFATALALAVPVAKMRGMGARAIPLPCAAFAFDFGSPNRGAALMSIRRHDVFQTAVGSIALIGT